MTNAIIDNFRALWNKRGLIHFLTVSRQKASLFRTHMGRFWLLLEPMGNMLIYYVMLTVIFHARERYGVNPFIFIMLGLSHFFIFSRMLSGSSGVFIARRNLLLQVSIEPLVFYGVVFREIFLEFLTFTSLFFVAFFITGHHLTLNFVVFYPLALAMLLLLSWSAGLLIAVMSVFVKDFQRLMGFLTRLTLYGSPVLYGLSFVPDRYLDIYMFNPLAPIFALLHAAIFNLNMPATKHIIFSAVFIFGLFLVAHMAYNMAKKQFTKVF